MIGTYDREQSWEKSQTWNLNNGAKVVVSYSAVYGDMISCIEFQGQVWHCSNGLDKLPAFATPWIEVVVASADIKLVRPKFDKVYP